MAIRAPPLHSVHKATRLVDSTGCGFETAKEVPGYGIVRVMTMTTTAQNHQNQPLWPNTVGYSYTSPIEHFSDTIPFEQEKTIEKDNESVSKQEDKTNIDDVYLVNLRLCSDSRHTLVKYAEVAEDILPPVMTEYYNVASDIGPIEPQILWSISHLGLEFYYSIPNSILGDHTRHRVSGPARVLNSGLVEFYRGGNLHRIGGPAQYNFLAGESTYRYWEFGDKHREDSRWSQGADGSYEWYYRGFLHNSQGPARAYRNFKNELIEEYYFHGIPCQNMQEVSYLHELSLQEDRENTRAAELINNGIRFYNPREKFDERAHAEFISSLDDPDHPGRVVHGSAIEFRDANGNLSRIGGPAYIGFDGVIKYMRAGVLHRSCGAPAKYNLNHNARSCEYYEFGKKHRIGKPWQISDNGESYIYYFRGSVHNKSGPAHRFVTPNGEIVENYLLFGVNYRDLEEIKHIVALYQTDFFEKANDKLYPVRGPDGVTIVRDSTGSAIGPRLMAEITSGTGMYFGHALRHENEQKKLQQQQSYTPKTTVKSHYNGGRGGGKYNAKKTGGDRQHRK